MLIIEKKAPTMWLLVKVPKITADNAFGDYTVASLREAVRDNHMGGERAGVRRLTAREIKALQFVHANRPRKAVPL